MDVIELSKFVIRSCSGLSVDGINVSKIQKLIYYISVWGIVSGLDYDKLKFIKKFSGPVNAELEHYFNSDMSGLKASEPETGYYSESSNMKFLQFICENYAVLDELTLTAMIYHDEAWIATPLNTVIETEIIKTAYSKQKFAKNFPLDLKRKMYYPPETNMYFAFNLDHDEKSNTGYQSYEKYKELKAITKQRFHEEFRFLR